MSDEQRVKRNRVFILGAGFSAGAGIPLTEELLKSSLKLFSTVCPWIFSRVVNYAKESIGDLDNALDYSRINFSELCTYLEYVELREHGGGERFCENGSREKLALRYYLAKTIVKCTPQDPHVLQLYLDFAAQLHAGDIILSLNWDGLLEVALKAVGKAYTYNFKDSDAIKLCKLHGSVNWRLGNGIKWRGSADVLAWESLRFTEAMMTREIYHTPELLDINSWHGFQPLGEIDPFLVLPGFGKAYDVRANAALWYKPEFAFATTHDVYVIGVRLAKDDFFVRSFFLSNLPSIEDVTGVEGRQIYVINPEERIENNYEFLQGKGNVCIIKKPFSYEHVEQMKRTIGDPPCKK
jgi:hypothetical protein